MENKQPKEVWIDANSALDKIWLLEKRLDTDIKYISEIHHNEVVSEKDSLIEKLFSKLDKLKEYHDTQKPLINQLQKIVESNKLTIKDMKAEIDSLKSEKQLHKNNSVTLTIDSTQYQTKWCDCKNLEKSTANFICHGQCKY